MTAAKNKSPLPKARWLMLAAAAALIWGCSGTDQQPREETPQEASCVSVDITLVEKDDLEQVVRGIGTVEAFQRVAIYPELSGVIESVHFDEGAPVEKNDLLFTIDDAKIRAQLRARKAALEEAQANLENARLVYDRRQRLFKQKLGTEEARDEARARHQALQAQVKRIEAEIENMEETLADTRIRAPFDGITGEHHVDPGQLVDTQTLLTSLVQTDPLKVTFTLPERYMEKVKSGQQIRLSVPAFGDKQFAGKVYFVSAQIKPATRSLQVKAHLDNAREQLRPGGFGTVAVVIDVRQNVPVIPEEALVPTRTGYMVFVVKDDKAFGRDVEIGLRNPGVVEITRGLEVKETIVRAGHISLYEGAKICSR